MRAAGGKASQSSCRLAEVPQTALIGKMRTIGKKSENRKGEVLEEGRSNCGKEEVRDREKKAKCDFQRK